ncbi:hypothetical protein [Nocardia crassostreae]|uniref:hypothetical protein n=1 Tax=Nocardia crassostreae TaxID=53428 RepID=UPI0008310CFE|nr:hypothetical protein [Nocardia crassostreae]
MKQRTTSPLTLIAAGTLTLAALTACSDTDTDPHTGHTTPAPTTVRADDTPTLGDPVHCGTGPWDLAVVAFTTKGPDFCPTALSVVNAYADARKQQPEGDIPVVIDNIRWVCGERQGDSNPFQQCASQNESQDKIRLLS